MSPVKVNVDNFARAESDRMFVALQAQAGGVNQWQHNRAPTQVDQQTVIRMNRDTLYSAAIVDISRGGMLTVPDAAVTRTDTVLAGRAAEASFVLTVECLPSARTGDPARRSRGDGAEPVTGTVSGSASQQSRVVGWEPLVMQVLTVTPSTAPGPTVVVMVDQEAARTALREFLTTRRGRITSGDAGLPASGRRRVTGLRREEVGMVAGISPEYYIRLERGTAAASVGGRSNGSSSNPHRCLTRPGCSPTNTGRARVGTRTPAARRPGHDDLDRRHFRGRRWSGGWGWRWWRCRCSSGDWMRSGRRRRRVGDGGRPRSRDVETDGPVT